MTDGVSEPGRIGVLGKRAAVGPDGAPLMFALEELQNAAARWNELEGQRKKHDAREAGGIALQNGIVTVRDSPRSVAGTLLIESGLRPRRHRRNGFFRSDAFRAAAALVLPHAGEIALRSGKSCRVRRVLLLRG